MATIRQAFLGAFQREHPVTLRVLRAYPEDQLELKPHPRAKTARDVIWPVALGDGLITKALTTGFDWAKPSGPPAAPPATVAEMAEAFEREHRRALDALAAVDDAALEGTVQFFTGPKTLGDVPKLDFLWFILHDHIHHRGQFSIYLRLAGGRVPAIYGPSSDEPWT
jgi:uncharacterized damage-inducible protein DinB